MAMTFGTDINPNNSTHSLGSSSNKWKINGYVPEIVVVNVSASANTSVSIQNSSITADHIVINQYSSIPNDVSYTTSAGYISLTCSAGIPAMTLFLSAKAV